MSDERGDDSKVVAKRIKIGAKLDVAGIIKAHAEYVKERCTSEKRGGYMASVSGGYGASVSGGYGASVSGGDGASVSGGYGASVSGGDKAKGNRTLISAWVDRDVWTEIRTLAQYRAAKGGVNHLGQPMSAGRLVEEALRLYLDQEENRKDLDKWYAFIKD